MTPIEKAAEKCWDLAIDSGASSTYFDPSEFATIIKRELEKAVPERETGMPGCGAGTEKWNKYERATGHNACRKAIGLD